MLDIQAHLSPSSEAIFSQFSDVLLASWESLHQEIEVQVLHILDTVIKKRFQSWEPSVQSLTKYPFLSDLTNFLKDYLQCVVVDTSNLGMQVSFDDNKLQQKGIPSFFPELLEYGDMNFSPLPHFQESMQIWDQECRPRLIEKLKRIVEERLNNE